MPDRSDLEAKTRYDPSEVEPRIAEQLAGQRAVPSRAGGLAGGELLDRDPAPERDRRAPHGARPEQLDPGLPDPLPPDARPADQVDPRHRPRRDRHPDPGRARAGRRGLEPRAARPGGVRRAGVGWRERIRRRRSSSSSSAWAPRCDYEDERFTLDDAYARAVQKVFVELYEKGYIYRDRYMVNWDPGERLGDLRPRGRGPRGHRHPLLHRLPAGRRDRARSRWPPCGPETMLADMAVAVHPDDERYERLVGEKAILPLVGRKLKIIADEYVKPEFGTGALKITPGHDPNDFEIGRRHGLAQISVIGEDGRITDEAPERFRGLTVEQARDAVVAELREQGLIARTEPYTHDGAVLAALGRADRAARLAAVVHAHGRAGQAGDRRRAERAGPVLARELHARLPELDGEHPALVHLAPAVVGPPDPGLVPRRGALRGHRAARGRGLGARPRRARHLVQLGAVPVRRRSAGPRTRRRCARSTRPTCWSPAGTSSSCGWRG